MAGHGRPLSPGEVSRLKALRLAHMRMDLAPSSPDSDEVLQRATNDARLLGVPLEVALHLTDKAEDVANVIQGITVKMS